MKEMLAIGSRVWYNRKDCNYKGKEQGGFFNGKSENHSGGRKSTI